MIKLYDQNVDKIKTYKKGDTVVFDGANMYVEKLTEAQLNSIGLYFIEYGEYPNRRYYTAIPTRGLVGNKFVIGYTPTERPLDEIKGLMIKDLFEHGEKKENEAKVTTSLGITVEANPRAQKAFELGAKRGVTRVRDENFMPHDVTVPQVNQILSEIEDKLYEIFTTKETKFDEIIALPTVAACANYENESYDYTVTQADVDADIEGTLTVGQVISKVRNNVKDW